MSNVEPPCRCFNVGQDLGFICLHGLSLSSANTNHCWKYYLLHRDEAAGSDSAR